MSELFPRVATQHFLTKAQFNALGRIPAFQELLRKLTARGRAKHPVLIIVDAPSAATSKMGARRTRTVGREIVASVVLACTVRLDKELPIEPAPKPDPARHHTIVRDTTTPPAPTGKRPASKGRQKRRPAGSR